MCTYMRVCVYIHACLCVVCSHSGREGSSVIEGGNGALLSVKRKVFFLQLFEMDVYSIHLFKENRICTSCLIIPDILRQ